MRGRERLIIWLVIAFIVLTTTLAIVLGGGAESRCRDSGGQWVELYGPNGATFGCIGGR